MLVRTRRILKKVNQTNKEVGIKREGVRPNAITPMSTGKICQNHVMGDFERDNKSTVGKAVISAEQEREGKKRFRARYFTVDQSRNPREEFSGGPYRESFKRLHDQNGWVPSVEGEGEGKPQTGKKEHALARRNRSPWSESKG